MYVKMDNGRSIGLLGSYVDDCLFAGNNDFTNYIEQTQTRFESKPAKWDNVDFLGVRIETNQQGSDKVFEVSQRSHIEKLQEIPTQSSLLNSAQLELLSHGYVIRDLIYACCK